MDANVLMSTSDGTFWVTIVVRRMNVWCFLIAKDMRLGQIYSCFAQEVHQLESKLKAACVALEDIFEAITGSSEVRLNFSSYLCNTCGTRQNCHPTGSFISVRAALCGAKKPSPNSSKKPTFRSSDTSARQLASTTVVHDQRGGRVGECNCMKYNCLALLIRWPGSRPSRMCTVAMMYGGRRPFTPLDI